MFLILLLFFFPAQNFRTTRTMNNDRNARLARTRKVSKRQKRRSSPPHPLHHPRKIVTNGRYPENVGHKRRAREKLQMLRARPGVGRVSGRRPPHRRAAPRFLNPWFKFNWQSVRIAAGFGVTVEGLRSDFVLFFFRTVLEFAWVLIAVRLATRHMIMRRRIKRTVSGGNNDVLQYSWRGHRRVSISQQHYLKAWHS